MSVVMAGEGAGVGSPRRRDDAVEGDDVYVKVDQPFA